jgi:predicted nucleotidyltransferase
MEAEATTDARKTLAQLAAAIERHCGSDLLGLYLFGSLVGGGFYAGKSDLDVMAVVTAEVEEGQQLEELRALHAAFVAERPAWVERIEVAYVDRDVLRTLADRPRGRIAVICPGGPLGVLGCLDQRPAQYGRAVFGEAAAAPRLA